MQELVRVLIVDDRSRSRLGLKALLATCPEIEVIGEAADGREAVHMAEMYQPDVILMDARMPTMDGLEATRRIKDQWPEIKIIVLTMFSSYQPDAKAACADVFLMKGCPTETLFKAILSR